MKLFAAAMAAALAAVPAKAGAAELVLKAVQWEAGVKGKGVQTRFAPLEAWAQKPGDKPPAPTRLMATVENAGTEEVDGVVVRFAVTAKIAPAAGGEGVWVVPFELGESRIPKLKPRESRTVALLPIHIASYLNRLARQGFWPEAFKAQVMVDPKTGDELSSNVKELTLPVKR